MMIKTLYIQSRLLACGTIEKNIFHESTEISATNGKQINYLIL